MRADAPLSAEERELRRRRPSVASVLGSPSRLFATWFGSGLSPVAPGTAGTAATVPLYFLACASGQAAILVPLAAVVVTAIGIFVSTRVERLDGVHDAGHIVIDEAAGFLIASCFGAAGWATAILAFVLFRLIDVCKPPFVQRLERLPRGWGIMADDVGAGLVAGLVLWLASGLLDGHWLGVLAAPATP